MSNWAFGYLMMSGRERAAPAGQLAVWEEGFTAYRVNAITSWPDESRRVHDSVHVRCGLQESRKLRTGRALKGRNSRLVPRHQDRRRRNGQVNNPEAMTQQTRGRESRGAEPGAGGRSPIADGRTELRLTPGSTAPAVSSRGFSGQSELSTMNLPLNVQTAEYAKHTEARPQPAFRPGTRPARGQLKSTGLVFRVFRVFGGHP